MTGLNEIYAHNINVRRHTEEELDSPLYVVNGRDWEGVEFDLYLREDEAKSLLIQLGYQVYEYDAP